MLAIEPQPDIFERLAYNIRQNPFGTVKALDCAVADKTGEVTLFVDMTNHGESSVEVRRPRPGPGGPGACEGAADLLKDERLERVDAIKLDVEGAEDLILQPFLRNAPASMLPQPVHHRERRRPLAGGPGGPAGGARATGWCKQDPREPDLRAKTADQLFAGGLLRRGSGLLQDRTA